LSSIPNQTHQNNVFRITRKLQSGEFLSGFKLRMLNNEMLIKKLILIQ